MHASPAPQGPTLEARILLSAVNVQFAGSTLTIRGTTGDDNYTVVNDSGSIDVLLNDAGEVYETGIAAADVTKIVIYGNSGNDKLTLDASVGSIQGVLYGQDGDDILTGAAGDDTLVGGNGNDIMTGHAGNETFRGEAGFDRQSGGLGDDRFTIDVEDTLSSSPSIVGGEGRDTIDARQATSGVTLFYNATSSEVIHGSQFGDIISGYGATDNLVIYGNGGNDQLTGGSGNDTIQGGDGDDSITGGAGNDRLAGNAGADTLLGGDGDDTLFIDQEDIVEGGSGRDTVDARAMTTGLMFNMIHSQTEVAHGTNFDDTFFNEFASWNLVIYGYAGNDYIEGGEANDTIYGGTGDDTIIGYGGNDRLSGDAGVDVLLGGDGDDTLLIDYEDTGSFTTDNHKGGAGRDVIDARQSSRSVFVNMLQSEAEVFFGSEFSDHVFAPSFFEDYDGPLGIGLILYGMGGDDVLQGSYLFNDTIDGGEGNDTIFGAGGNDRLIGGQGVDEIHGGSGDDTLIIDHEDTFDGGDGTDIVDARTSTQGIFQYLEASQLEVFYGSEFSDRIYDYSNSNIPLRLYGFGGDDSLFGGTGNDFIDGGQGDDVIVGDTENPFGTIGNDRLIGGAGADEINGAAGNDVIIMDHLDTVSAAQGRDTLDARSSTQAVTINVWTSQAEVFYGSNHADQFFVSKVGAFYEEPLTINGFAGADQYHVVPNSNGDVISITSGETANSLDTLFVYEPVDQNSSVVSTGLNRGHVNTTNGYGRVSFSGLDDVRIQSDLDSEVIATSTLVAGPLVNGQTIFAPEVIFAETLDVTGKVPFDTMQLENRSSEDLIITSVAVTGDFSLPGHSSFEESSPIPPAAFTPLTIGALQSGRLRLFVKADTTGLKTGTITISTNDADTPTLTYELSAQTYAEGDIYVTRPLSPYSSLSSEPGLEPKLEDGQSLDFGIVPASQGHAEKIRIYNFGNKPLVITDWLSTGDFRVGYIKGVFEDGHEVPSFDEPYTISAGDYVDVDVILDPASTGVKSGTVSIVTNDPETPSFDLILSAMATDAPLIEVWTPSAQISSGEQIELGTLSFGFEGNPPRITFSIYNPGDTELLLSQIVGVSGDFSLVSPPSSTLPSGHSVQVTIELNNTFAGDQFGGISISSNALDEPLFEFTLKGYLSPKVFFEI